MPSREEATKYAKAAAAQAATELRGRLSRWGFQAASAVQELREERQRKIKEEHQKEETQKGDHRNEGSSVTVDAMKKISVIENVLSHDSPLETNTKPCSVETSAASSSNGNIDKVRLRTSENNVGNTAVAASLTTSPLSVVTAPNESFQAETMDSMESCHIYLQTPSGFLLLSLSEESLCAKAEKEENTLSSNDIIPPVTNTSVISVRLSKDRACTVGKSGGFTFQWYRSTNRYKEESSADLGEDQNNQQSCGSSSSSTGWSLLPGACYAAYQPSVSDAGHRLCCLIEFRTGDNVTRQVCVLPCIVSIDQPLFDAAKTTLLAGKNSAMFGSLVGMGIVFNFR